MKVGILDIQGSVKEHFEALKKCKVPTVLVKTVDDLNEVSGLIIPGGESTTIGKLLKRFGLGNEIIKRVRNGMPVWGTCAGAILLAKKIINDEKVDGLNLMNIEISRNSYGRQVDSFETEIEFDFDGAIKKIPAVFIRAPKIAIVGKGVKILAKYGQDIVAAREKNMLSTTFHPEMTNNISVHKYFIEMC